MMTMLQSSLSTKSATMMYIALVIGCLLSSSFTDAFVSAPRTGVSSSSSSSLLQALPTPEESAKQLSDYMAKAHEEKLKAIRQAEVKKEGEIMALRKEVEELKQKGPSAITASTASTGSPQELAEKLLSYQQFMAEYIVKAQQEKLKAVEAAEASTAKKYEDKLLLLGGSTSPAASSSSITTASSSSSTNKLFMVRNAKVSAAGNAGKSRWGDMETQRAATAVGGPPPVPTAMATSVSATVINGAATANGATVNGASAPRAASLSSPPPEVVEADHGLRNDGGVGGPSLAERVALGASVVGAGASAAPPSLAGRSNQLYQLRNARIAAAAEAGKSRWGSMENDKAKTIVLSLGSSPSMTVTPEVVEADHGLRADGGVGGPTLAERVNLGAQLLQK